MTYQQSPQDPRQWQTQPGYGPYGQAYPPPRPPKRSSNTALILVVIGAALLVVFGGCAILVTVISSAPSSTREPVAGPAGTQPDGQPAKSAKLGTAVRDGKFEFTVTSTETAAKIGDDILGQTAKGEFVIVHMHVANIGDQAQYFAGDAQKLIDDKGREYSATSAAAIYIKDSKSLYEQINPGLQVDGVVVFDVPKDVKVSAIELHDSVFSDGVRVALT